MRGATQFGEPGVLLTFEETADEMTKNVASLGFDLADLTARKKLTMDYVRIEPSEIQETGSYDLEGLFIRLRSRSIRSARNALCWTRRKRFSRDFPIKGSCERKSEDCSDG